MLWNVNCPHVSNPLVLGTLQNATNWQMDYRTKILLKHIPTIKMMHINKHTVTVCSKLYIIKTENLEITKTEHHKATLPFPWKWLNTLFTSV